MYGTIMRYRTKPGSEAAALALTKEFLADPPAGFVASYTYRLDSGGDEYVTAAVFNDKDAYLRNANDPRQDQWFKRFQALLAGDVEWNDGELIEAVNLASATR
jgi:antibiotic biosynthesis monooxygenase (ABM) superfamily enzyme